MKRILLTLAVRIFRHCTSQLLVAATSFFFFYFFFFAKHSKGFQRFLSIPSHKLEKPAAPTPRTLFGLWSHVAVLGPQEHPTVMRQKKPAIKDLFIVWIRSPGVLISCSARLHNHTLTLSRVRL